MDAAVHLAAAMVPCPVEIIVFHCQQAAEKYLKGALVILGEEPPYIHDLDKRCAFAGIASLCAVKLSFGAVAPRCRVAPVRNGYAADPAPAKSIREFLLIAVPELFQG